MLDKIAEEIVKIQRQLEHPKNHNPGDYDWLCGRLNGLRTAQYIARGWDQQSIDGLGRIRKQ